MRAIPDPVDLAIVVVPKHLVQGVAEECGQKGVKGLVVITAGFAEVGGEGIEREAKLLETVKRYGMRMVGPNCMGVLNSSPDFSMNATFAPTMPPYGPVGFISQSGAMGLSILDYAEELGIGIHQFVSVGNKADVSGNDLLLYWADDPEIRVILMYLESFGNPRRFYQIARELTRKKPIFVVKAGRTAAGARAASSHTAALAGTDLAADALMEQCGVMRAQTVEELFDYAMAFPRLPLPKGNRVAIVSNAGGPAIILADACESLGLVGERAVRGDAGRDPPPRAGRGRGPQPGGPDRVGDRRDVPGRAGPGPPGPERGRGDRLGRAAAARQQGQGRRGGDRAGRGLAARHPGDGRADGPAGDPRRDARAAHGRECRGTSSPSRRPAPSRR